MALYKIALSAGHFLGTAGKNIPKELDANQTKEWVLNNRTADKVEDLLQGYTGYELLRLDDTTGKKNISLTARTNAANNWGATEYYSIHHNAKKGKPWSGGGIAIYVYNKASAASLEMQKELYDALIEATGLIGNRATPLAKANYHEVRETRMPAVLMELGFMDSKTDAPIILTEEYADKCAAAIVKVMVKRGGLKKKEAAPAAVTVALRQVRQGDKDGEVYTLQALLNQFVERKIVVDGDFGPATKSALIAFQTTRGLNPTGVADKATWEEVLKDHK